MPTFADQRRVVDQMMSMQAHLRDRTSRRSTVLSNAVLCLSAVATALAFLDGEKQRSFFGVVLSQGVLVAWLALAVFCLTLIDLSLERKAMVRKREAAVNLLSDLKSEIRDAETRILATPAAAAQITADLLAQYARVMGTIEPIPEKYFASLKSKHLRKVELSKILSEKPGITLRQAKKVLKERAAAATAQP